MVNYILCKLLEQLFIFIVINMKSIKYQDRKSDYKPTCVI